MSNMKILLILWNLTILWGFLTGKNVFYTSIGFIGFSPIILLIIIINRAFYNHLINIIKGNDN